MQMERKVKIIDLPLARKSEQRLHQTNDYLQNSIEESAFWTMQEVYDEKLSDQDFTDNTAKLVDLISMDPLSTTKRPSLQHELCQVV